MRIKTFGVTRKAVAEKYQHFRWALLNTGKSGMAGKENSKRRNLQVLFSGNCKEQDRIPGRIRGEICGILQGNPGSKSNTCLTPGVKLLQTILQMPGHSSKPYKKPFWSFPSAGEGRCPPFLTCLAAPSRPGPPGVQRAGSQMSSACPPAVPPLLRAPHTWLPCPKGSARTPGRC